MNWLYSLPRALLVTLIIVIGVAFIILRSPPKTLCDLQEEVYRKNNINFLFKDQRNKVLKQTTYQQNEEECRENNSPGGCYSLFHGIHRLIQSFRVVTPQCHKSIAQIREVRSALMNIYSLFLEITWAEGKNRSETASSLSWLSFNDVADYCKLKNQIVYFYGQSELNQLEKNIHRKIGSDVAFEDFARFSILSENCNAYPQ